MKVLIVEDEVLIALHLEMLVTQLGHEVCAIALCADEAVAHAGLHRPDLALMDIHLARGTSGIVAACKMHDLYGIRCIFLSGNLEEAAHIAVHSCDPVDILGKPVLALMLQRALEKAELDARLNARL